MLQLQHLTLYRDHQKVCEDLSVNIAKGECLLIEGKTGSGKTTLMECLLGRLKPSHGEVLLDGHDLHLLDRSEQQQFLASTGIVLQDNLLRPHDTLEQSLSQDGVTPENLRYVLSLLHFEDRAQRPIRQFSHAEQRKIDLARSLAKRPKLILWDEPFLGLDKASKMDFQRELLALKSSGSTLVIASSSPHEFDFLNPEKIMTL